MNRRWITFGVALTVGCGSWYPAQLLAKTKTESKTPSKKESKSAQAVEVTSAGSERLTTEKLGGVDRFLTYVSTDKPIYKAGEQVYLRGIILNAANHRPLPSAQTGTAQIQIKGPKGDIIATGNATTADSVWGYSWTVPAEQAGGEYTAYVTYPWNGLPAAERKFDVRSYRAPRISSQITFARDGYGPGDKVTATLDAKRAEGGVPENAKVTAIARVDGAEIQGVATNVDEKGNSTVTFDLPHDIPRGEGTLSLAIEDGGVVETASKTIPILLQTVDLKIYPEGGDLVAGFKNRVYIQANQPNGKPADLSGDLMWRKDSQTGVVTSFQTAHEGRGRFVFTPEGDKEYFLSISKPTGIKTTYPLPEIKFKGAVISTESDTFKKGQPIKVMVGCSDKKCTVTLTKKEIAIASDVELKTDKHRAIVPVTFDASPNADGVLVVTVWDENGLPLAERLIFREPAKTVNVSISADKTSYAPGDAAKVTVKTTDESGKPVSSVVGLTMTDDSVLELVERREKAPRLPVMVFLEPEVQELADATMYMDNTNPKAPMMTDLLLGTQGWRRFAFVDVDKFIDKNGDAAKRVVALNLTPVGANGERISRVNLGRVGQQAWNGVPIGALAGGSPAVRRGGNNALKGSVAPQMGAQMGVAMGIPQALRRGGERRAKANFDQMYAKPANMPVEQFDMADAAKVRAPRDKNMFQVEPTVIDERHYTSGRSFRHQKGSGVLAPQMTGQLAQLSSVDKYTFFPGYGGAPVSVLVREYAHKVEADHNKSDRKDFEETIYWNAGVKTDAKSGEATVNVDLNDNVTTFRVFADAFTDGGAVGTASKGVESARPIYADVKLPLEVTSGDNILLPINVVNGTKNPFPEVKLKVDLDGSSKLLTLQKSAGNTEASGRVRWIQPIKVGMDNDVKNLTVSASAAGYEDKVTRKLLIKPQGFPTEVAFGGVLEPGKPAIHTITIAKNIAQGSVTSSNNVYPTPLANMTEALQRLILDPNGCFEQTSSTSYPLTMAQQYFTSHTAVDPKLVATSREKLNDGYKKLVSFWCPDRGYEWFGENPGHEALTAFGLLHFTDMQQVMSVDPKMVTTTREWLMKQKDGQGGFTRKRRALHSWIEDKDCSNAYIIWALLETGQPATDLKPELTALKTAAEASKNSYVTALAANAMFLSGDKTEAKKLTDRLASKQKSDGSIEGVTSSIVGSGGESLEIEGLSLATLAWLRDPAYAANVEKSIKFLAESCKAGRYGSTQATVLALRAIVAYDKLHAHPKSPGKIREYIDGKPIGDYVIFGQSTQGAIKLPDVSELLTPGEHKIELRMEGGSPMPYAISTNYNALTPASSQSCKLDLAVRMAQDKVTEGNATEAIVTVTNVSDEVVPSPVAIVGIPGGVEVRHDQLKELKKKGVIDNYEVRGRELVLYWRTLDKKAKIEVPVSVIAAIPGTYTGPASRAYLYYTDENKDWEDGLKIDIAAK